jgi:hypothetical protein
MVVLIKNTSNIDGNRAIVTYQGTNYINSTLYVLLFSLDNFVCVFFMFDIFFLTHFVFDIGLAMLMTDIID